MVNKDNSMKRTKRKTWSFMSFVSITFLSVSFCVHMVGGVMEYPSLAKGAIYCVVTTTSSYFGGGQ